MPISMCVRRESREECIGERREEVEENHVAEKEVPLMFGEDFLHGRHCTGCYADIMVQT